MEVEPSSFFLAFPFFFLAGLERLMSARLKIEMYEYCIKNTYFMIFPRSLPSGGGCTWSAANLNLGIFFFFFFRGPTWLNPVWA